MNRSELGTSETADMQVPELRVVAPRCDPFSSDAYKVGPCAGRNVSELLHVLSSLCMQRKIEVKLGASRLPAMRLPMRDLW